MGLKNTERLPIVLNIMRTFFSDLVGQQQTDQQKYLCLKSRMTLQREYYSERRITDFQKLIVDYLNISRKDINDHQLFHLWGIYSRNSFKVPTADQLTRIAGFLSKFQTLLGDDQLTYVKIPKGEDDIFAGNYHQPVQGPANNTIDNEPHPDWDDQLAFSASDNFEERMP